jgi:hypothetical protein
LGKLFVFEAGPMHDPIIQLIKAFFPASPSSLFISGRTALRQITFFKLLGGFSPLFNSSGL